MGTKVGGGVGVSLDIVVVGVKTSLSRSASALGSHSSQAPTTVARWFFLSNFQKLHSQTHKNDREREMDVCQSPSLSLSLLLGSRHPIDCVNTLMILNAANSLSYFY